MTRYLIAIVILILYATISKIFIVEKCTTVILTIRYLTLKYKFKVMRNNVAEYTFDATLIR